MMWKAEGPLILRFEVSFIVVLLVASSYTLTAQSIAAQKLSVFTNAMVWDATRSLFFCSSGTNVLLINPETAQVVDTIAVGNRTGQLAISDDGQFLYVALESTSSGALGTINGYTVQDHSLNLQIQLGIYPGRNIPLDAAAMIVLPGQASSLLIALTDGSVKVLDGAVARPSSAVASITSLHVRASDGAIFGYGDGIAGFGTPRIWSLTVSNSGVSVARSIAVHPNWDNGTVIWNGNLVTNKGQITSFVFDLNAGATIGTLPLPAGTGSSGSCVLRPDSSGASAIVYEYNYLSNSSVINLVQYSISNLEPIASVSVTPWASDYTSLSSVCDSMVATWGTDGIVMSDQDGNLIFLQASGFAPVTPAPVPTPTRDGSGVIHLALPANGLVYDSGRNLIWASIPGSAGTAGNSVVSIDPATGIVAGTIYAGSEPGSLALSADGSHLFTALGGAPAIASVDLGAKQSSYFTGLTSTSPYWSGVAVAAIAGTSNSVVAITSLSGTTTSIGSTSVVAYDAGVPRKNTFDSGTGAYEYNNLVQVIFPADASNAYYAADVSENHPGGTHDLFRLLVDATGVTLDSQLNDVFLGSGSGAYTSLASNQPASMVYESGRLFTSGGQILTPNVQQLLGSVALNPEYGFPVPLTDQNAVAYVQSASTQINANVYDLGTFRPLSSVPLLSGPSCLCTTNGLNSVNVIAAVRAGSSIAVAANGEIVIAPLSSMQPWSTPKGSVSTVSTGLQLVDLPVNAINVLPGTSQLLLATPSTAGQVGNSIVTFDPVARQVINTTFIGNEPSILAPTPDGSAVYVFLSGELNVGRFNVASSSRDLVFTPDPTGGANQVSVFDMAAGNDGGLALSYSGTFAFHGAVQPIGVDGAIAVFDGSTLRPKVDMNTEGVDAGDPATFELAFNDTGSILYAYNSFLSTFELKQETVSSQGVQWLSTTPGLIGGYYSAIRYAKGLLYTSYGDVVDPGRLLVVGRFVDGWLNQQIGTQVAPDPANGRVYFITASGILIFDINTYSLLGRLAISVFGPNPEYPVSLVRFGSDGLAFHTSAGHLYLVTISSIPLLQSPVPSPQPASIAVNGIVPVFSSTPVIQPGSWISIFGANLATTTAAWNNDFPTSLAGVSVTINYKPAYLEFVSPGTINVQAPDDTATGLVPVSVMTPNGTAQGSVTLAAFGPSLSLFDGSHVAAEILTPDGSGDYGGGSYDLVGPTGQFSFPTRPVNAGETLVLYGVGFGPTTPSVNAGKPFSGAAPTINTVTVTIGGISAKVLFSGITAAGLYQINVVVPPVAGGDQLVEAVVAGNKAPAALVTIQ